MKKRIIKNLIFSVIAFAAIIVVNFLLPRLMPGDPLANLIGADVEAISQEEYDALRRETGLDKPMSEQFGDYLKGVFTGEWGYSYHRGDDVGKLIAQKMPATLQIAFPAWLISALLSLWLGVNAGYRKSRPLDYALSGTMVVVDAVPSFLMAIVLLILFAFKWDLLPSGALNSVDAPSGVQGFADRLTHLVLPVITLVIVSTPKKYMLMRNLTASATDEQYMTYAKSKGLSASRIKFTHIFPNVSGAFLSMLGTSFGHIVAGSIVIETVFSIDGIGLLVSKGISDLDYPVLQGAFLVIALCVLVSNFISDVVCALVDPRQRRTEV